MVRGPVTDMMRWETLATRPSDCRNSRAAGKLFALHWVAFVGTGSRSQIRSNIYNTTVCLIWESGSKPLGFSLFLRINRTLLWAPYRPNSPASPRWKEVRPGIAFRNPLFSGARWCCPMWISVSGTESKAIMGVQPTPRQIPPKTIDG